MKYIPLLLSSFILISAATSAFAQTVDDLYTLVQQSRTVINNNASIDPNNVETVSFATSIAGQLVELNLAAGKLNDSFISALNYPQPAVLSQSGACVGPLSRSTPTPITFGNMHVILDGCDITAALLAQCNANNCWVTNPTTPLTQFSGMFGTAIYINLSVLNPQAITGCTPAAGQTTFFDASHLSHTLQFAETATTAPAGGSLNYQVVLFNKAY
jgi:hypothetical protein